MTKIAITALAFTLGATGVLLCSCSDAEAPSAAIENKSIKVFHIQKKSVTDTGDWIGYLRGVQDTDLYPRVSGFITEYKEGQYVKQGEVIYQIDPKPFEAELARAEANLQSAKASLEQAESSRDKLKLDLERYEPLIETGGVSAKQVSDVRHNYAAALAKVEACMANIKQQEAAVQKAKINLNYAGIKAPYDGFVGTSHVSTGDLVGQSTKLGNIISEGPLRVDFAINSDALSESFETYGKVKSDTVNPELKDRSPQFELLLEDGSVYEHKGRLLSMNSIVDDTGLIDIIGEVDNPDGKLRGGMKINVRIPLQTQDALLVPQAAIRSVMSNQFIIVVDKQNVPHTVPVTLGKVYDVEVEESDGFKSVQPLVAIYAYKDINLEETFKQYGYEDPTQVPVVADTEKGVIAMNMSSANSRIPQQKKAMAEAYQAQEDSLLSGLLVALGLEEAAPHPDTLKPSTIQSIPLSFKPVNPQPIQEQASQPEKTNVAATMPPVPVKVMKLLQQDVDIAMDWYGTLRGKEETNIRPQISGFLQKQHFRNGTIVNEGDILFTIDPAPYEAALAEAKANLAAAKAGLDEAKAQLEKAKNDYERFSALAKESPAAVKEQDITDALSSVHIKTAAVKQAEAQIAQMEANVLSAQINVDYTVIRAPFTGRAGISNPSLGSLVAPSDATPLVTLSSLNPMRIDFQVSGRDALQITNKVGKNNPNGALEFDILMEDGSTYPAKGRIVSPDNVVKKTTGTFGIVAEVENVTNGLRSGMPVTVRASLKQRKAAFLVPARAPMNANGIDMLVLVGTDGAPNLVPIKKGPLVTLSVKENSGEETVQPMQIVELNPQLLQKNGYSDFSKIEVVVEGSLKAAMTYQENMKLGARANKLAPIDFHYVIPKTVEPSVTADDAPTSRLNKF